MSDPDERDDSRSRTDRDEDAQWPGGVSDFGISGLPSDVEVEHPSPDDARFKVAGFIRRINSLVVGRPASDEALDTLAARLADVGSEFERSTGPGRRPRPQPDPSGPAQDFFTTSPAIGFANPVAPPVIIEKSDQGIEGRAWFDNQYEGPPGCVHGGILSLVFDDILGAVNIAANSPGMTGTLTVRYLRPTPIRSNLRIEARLKSREGRKIITWGGIYKGDELTAEAEGVFIQLGPERFLRNIAKYGNQEDPPDQITFPTTRD